MGEGGIGSVLGTIFGLARAGQQSGGAEAGDESLGDAWSTARGHRGQVGSDQGSQSE
jgi:hypothetical protein